MLKQRFEVTIVDIYRATLKAFSLSKRTLMRYSQLLFQIEIECKALENDVNSQTNLILFHKVSHVISSRKYQVSVLELENVVFKIEFFFFSLLHGRVDGFRVFLKSDYYCLRPFRYCPVFGLLNSLLLVNRAWKAEGMFDVASWFTHER